MHNTLRLDTGSWATVLFNLWRTANLGGLTIGLFFPGETNGWPAKYFNFSLYWANFSMRALGENARAPNNSDFFMTLLLASIAVVPFLSIFALFVYIGMSVQQILFWRMTNLFWPLIALGPWIFVAAIWFLTGNGNDLGFWIVFIGIGSSILLETTSWLFAWASASPDAAQAKASGEPKS